MQKKVSTYLAVAVLLAILATQAFSFTASAGNPGANSAADSAGEPVVRYATRTDSFQSLREIQPGEPRWASDLHLQRKLLPNRPGEPNGDVDPVVQPEPFASSGTTLLSFEGVNNVNGVLPPDTVGDIGPNHYVQAVNLSFAVFDRSGNKLYGPANINTIWSGFGGACETTNDGDPIVLYDEIADRWLIAQFALPMFPRGPFYQCIAISQTGDPLAGWYRYEYLYSNSKMNDYFKIGVWTDGYYLTANQFSAPFLNWGGQGVVVFERDKMLLGQQARMVYFDLYATDPNLGGMLPSDLDGDLPPAGAPNIFAEIDDNAWGYSPDQIQLWQFDVDWVNTANSTFTKIGALPVAAFDSDMCGGSRNCIPQPGGTNVDAIADRLMWRLQYRNFGSYQTLLANHTVDATGADRAGVRWYELRNSGAGWSIYQQGTFSPDSTNRWMASIAMNGKGEIGLGYSVSSTSVYPSVRYTGRLPGDALGQMTQGESTIIDGSGWQDHSAGRWGDYSSLNVDPTDDCTFWYTQEYFTSRAAGNAAWQTRIGSFRLSTCDGGPVDNPPTVTITNPNDGATVSGTVTVRADASDDNGVTQVEFFVDGASIGVDTTAPYEASWNTTGASNGSHAVKAVATDTAGKTGQDINNVTVSNSSGDTTLHVGDLDATTTQAKRNWTATVTVTVHDGTENPVAGVTVTAKFSNQIKTVTCTTNTSGQCTLSRTTPNATTSVTLTVNNLSKSGYTYASGANHDTDGNSNGTSITVNK